MPAGEQLGVVAVLGEQRQRSVGRVHPLVVEPDRDHFALPAAARIATAATKYIRVRNVRRVAIPQLSTNGGGAKFTRRPVRAVTKTGIEQVKIPGSCGSFGHRSLTRTP
jgi:hypothetical protein